MVHENTIQYHSVIKSGFNGILNGIGTYFSTINQTSVVLSVTFENTIQYHCTIQ